MVFSEVVVVDSSLTVSSGVLLVFAFPVGVSGI